MNSMETILFGAVDYTVCVTVLCVSLAIGIYFGFFGEKLSSPQQYLSGGLKEIKLSTIAISLIASSKSASVLLTYPSEIYSYGSMFILSVPGTALALIAIAYIFIPLYYKAGVSNAYEYLDRRFDWKVHKMASVFYLFYTYAYSPIILYLPSLAFSQVTGANVHLINAVIGSICIIYTMIGGIKAVIWTDVVQASIMFLSALAVVVYGVINVGGLDVVFKRSAEGGRLHMFDFDPDLTKRNTFWIMLCICISTFIGHFAFNQTIVQRLIALKSEKHAKRAVLLYCIGYVTILVLILFSGLVIFATYYKCDPVRAKIISKGDKILPYFVMNTIGHWTGMPGLFIAAILSAGLSTLSAQMNSMSGILYQDFFRKWRLFKHTDFRAKLFMKMAVLITGIYFILAGFIVDNIGHILQMVQIIMGGTLGLTTGVFTLGMLTPWANKHGAFYGAIISGVLTIWMIIGNQIALKSGSISYPPLPTLIEDCDLPNNVTTIVNTTINTILSATNPSKPFILYRLSFFIFSMVTVVLVWVFGLLISFATGHANKRGFDTNLLATCMHWTLAKDIIATSGQEDDEELQVSLNKSN